MTYLNERRFKMPSVFYAAGAWFFSTAVPAMIAYGPKLSNSLIAQHELAGWVEDYLGLLGF